VRVTLLACPSFFCLTPSLASCLKRVKMSISALFILVYQSKKVGQRINFHFLLKNEKI